MGSKDERQSTRARANMLREFFNGTIPSDKLGYDEVKSVLDLCLSCKACKTECPSSVDMTKLKAEFIHRYHLQFGIPLRTRLVGALPRNNKWLMLFPYLYNKGIKWQLVKNFNQKYFGFVSKRSLPKLSNKSLTSWYRLHQSRKGGKIVYLFADEFTNYQESEIGIATIMLLEKLGYQVIIPKHIESGRTYLSKGMLNEAARAANHNVRVLASLVTKEHPVVGIEPSALLTLRDEYPELVNEELKVQARNIAESTYTIEEFIASEFDKGNIKQASFTSGEQTISFHSHCYQKALSDTSLTKKILEIPVNYKAEEIPSGCCGMAGSFGYEKEHYDLSMKIGELVLFPEVRKRKQESLIVAAGTSCRHQIKDGTDVEAQHPVQVLYEALV
jgi:Fe-S oxidoreductase